MDREAYEIEARSRTNKEESRERLARRARRFLMSAGLSSTSAYAHSLLSAFFATQRSVEYADWAQDVSITFMWSAFFLVVAAVISLVASEQ